MLIAKLLESKFFVIFRINRRMIEFMKLSLLIV